MNASTLRALPGYLFLLPYGLSFATFIVLPFVLALGLAFVKLDLASAQAATFVGLGNFVEAFGDAYFRKAVGVTLVFVALAVPSTVALGLGLAVGMHAMSSQRGRHAVRALLFVPGMLNVAVAAILWQWFYNGEFGLFNHLLRSAGLSGVPWLSEPTMAMLSVVVMTLWWTVGGSAILLLAGLQQIPGELWEAASLDGANAWQRFASISLPMIQPVLVFVVILNVIGGFQVFGQPYLLTRGGPELATRGVVQYIYETAFNRYRLGYGAAMSWLLFLMIVGFSLVQIAVLRRLAR